MAKPRGRSILWDHLNRGTAQLYRLMAGSFMGRILTGYRRVDAAFAGGKRYTGRHTCAPMSPARMKLLSAVESGLLFKGIRALFSGLFSLPLALYGLFLLTYGMAGGIAYFALPYVYRPLTPDLEHLVLSAVLTGLSLYDNLAKYGGAGTLVPITGFANAIAAPAVEFKTEGFILGVGAKIFQIAGPVIVYGVSASVVYGLIYWITTLF